MNAKETTSAANIVAVMSSLIEHSNADEAVLENAKAIIAENKELLRNGMIETLAKITKAVAKAAKTVNKHTHKGRPNPDKIAVALGYKGALEEVLAYFSSEDTAHSEQAKLVSRVVCDIDEMQKSKVYKKVEFVPSYPPLEGEALENSIREENKNLLTRVTNAVNHAIHNINRSILGEEDVKEHKIMRLAGYLSCVENLVSYFAATYMATELTQAERVKEMSLKIVSDYKSGALLSDTIEDIPCYPLELKADECFVQMMSAE